MHSVIMLFCLFLLYSTHKRLFGLIHRSLLRWIKPNKKDDYRQRNVRQFLQSA